MKIYQVDAFTEIPFKGNPAAVCILTAKYVKPTNIAKSPLDVIKDFIYYVLRVISYG